VLALLARAGIVRADVVGDWAYAATEIATDGPNTIRTLALVQNAVYEAVNAITARYPHDLVDLGTAKGASIDAAIAAASLGRSARWWPPRTGCRSSGCFRHTAAARRSPAI
jgi:hypothetical protein